MALNIEHRLCPPRCPQINGMVERFNGRISEAVNQTRFASATVLWATLHSYLKTYNHQIPQRALNHASPVQGMKNWQKKGLNYSRSRSITSPDLTGRCSVEQLSHLPDSELLLSQAGQRHALFKLKLLINYWRSLGSANPYSVAGYASHF